jgi:hypothetical protein
MQQDRRRAASRANFLRYGKELPVDQIPHRTMLRRGGALGAPGALFTRILPLDDERVVALYGEFERGLYTGLA